MTTVLGYVRVSTGVQPNSAAVQERAIRGECERRGWDLANVLSDLGESRSTLERPALAYTLARLARGDADVLVASRLDRLVGSWQQFSNLHDRAAAQGWKLLALDQPDVTTADGQLHAHMKCVMAEWERQTISCHTREALAALREAGKPTGRPAVADRPELLERIQAMHAGGMSLQAIADTLNAEGVPTIRGGSRWQKSSLQTALGYRRPMQRRPLSAA